MASRRASSSSRSGLVVDPAPVSACSVQRLKADWQGQYDAWHWRELAGLSLVYVWADGI
jgi:hypothetical protein